MIEPDHVWATRPAERDGAAGRAYCALRALAMTYGLPPGQRLNEVELAARLSVSRTPLREAMNRLSSEGLLTAERGRGFSARRLEVQDVVDLYEARLALETVIAEFACRRAPGEAIDALHAYLADSAARQESADIDRLMQLDEGFHLRVAALSGNVEFERMLANINARIYFFRWFDMRGRRDSTQREHRALLAAIAAGDVAGARDVLRHHITRRRDQIVETIREGYGRLYTGEGPSAAGLAPQLSGETA